MRNILQISICAVLVLFQGNASSCDGKDKWISVKASDLTKEKWRRHSETGFVRTHLDINGDGIDDRAFLVVSQDGAKSAVKICLGSKTARVDVSCHILAESENVKSVMGLEKRSSGCYEYLEDDAGNLSRGSICSKFDILEYFRFGSSASLFIFNQRSGNFDRYWTAN